MDAENLVVYNHRQRQEIEHIGEIRPYVRRPVLAYTFRVKTIGLSAKNRGDVKRNLQERLLK